MKLPHNIVLSGSFFSGTSGLVSDVTTEVDESAIAVTGQVFNKIYSAKVEYISATKKFPSTEVVSTGYFANATYMITKHIEVGVRCDNFDGNTEVEDDLLNRTTIMTGYNLNGINRIMLNYELRNKEKVESLGNLLTVQFQAAL